MKVRNVCDALGVWLTLADGSRLLDGASGVFNLPLGYRHPAVEAAIQQQREIVGVLPSDLRCEVNDQFERALAATAPAALGGTRVGIRCRDACGSTAIEGALKMAQRFHPDRHVVVTFRWSHHGQTLFTTGISGNSFRRRELIRRRARVLPYGEAGADLAEIEEGLAEADRAGLMAVVVEPSQGNGGNATASAEFIRLLESIRRKTGALLVLDEVQTGIGRLGEFWGADAVGFSNYDIIVSAKGLANGEPIGAQLFHPRLAGLLEPFDHSFTSGGSVTSLATAAAVLRIVNHPEFLEGVRKRGELLGNRLGELRERHRCVARVRGLGMMWGIEMVDKDGVPSAEIANELAAIALDECGLRLRTSRYGLGAVVKVRPALIASVDELDELIGRLDAALARLGDDSDSAPPVRPARDVSVAPAVTRRGSRAPR